MDDLDKQLIQELQKDGRRSNTHLARLAGVSEGCVRNRIKDLEQKGAFKIRAVLNPYETGYGFITVMGFQVRMSELQKVGKILAAKPNVYYLSFVAGRYDLIAIVLTKSPEELSAFIKEHISSISSIIRTETFVNLEVIKSPWNADGNIMDLLGQTSPV